ncbi:hypothetical protein XAP6984_250057 [Xanthomonas phaseoli pv. phaseoli]|uniref:Uncharacterized protein n=1 Tax=Xanthomonas campestris pv. phaseoli TaxID=317013 RepID=A0ABY1TP53_XANCH|nr:hypothetical protein XAP6984_250057 [Xanthomonas phaseoli pv. phaseoli]
MAVRLRHSQFGRVVLLTKSGRLSTRMRGFLNIRGELYKAPWRDASLENVRLGGVALRKRAQEGARPSYAGFSPWRARPCVSNFATVPPIL